MYEVFKAILKPTGEKFIQYGKDGKPLTLEWHKAEMKSLGFAESMAEANKKFGRGMLLQWHRPARFVH